MKVLISFILLQTLLMSCLKKTDNVIDNSQVNVIIDSRAFSVNLSKGIYERKYINGSKKISFLLTKEELSELNKLIVKSGLLKSTTSLDPFFIEKNNSSRTSFRMYNSSNSFSLSYCPDCFYPFKRGVVKEVNNISKYLMNIILDKEEVSVLTPSDYYQE